MYIENEIRIMQDNMDEINRITDLVYDELYYNRNFPVTMEGIKYAIAKWRAKKDSLIQLFSKHPNWNAESYMIQFDKAWVRELNTSIRDQFAEWAYNALYCKIEFCENTYEERLPMQLLKSNITFIINCMKSTKLDEDACIEIDSIIGRINMRLESENIAVDMFPFPSEGQKCSRYIRKLCDVVGLCEADNFERQFAMFADAMNPIIVKRHTCISLNPLDYMLASNGNSWRSCYSLGNYSYDRYDGNFEELHDRPGEHIGGTLSYMLDETSFVEYTVAKEYDGDRIELEYKITRCYCAYKDGALLQQRVYPQSNDRDPSISEQHRKVAQKVIADCLNEPDLWTVKDGCSARNVCVQGFGYLGYPDWVYQDSEIIHISFLNSMPRIEYGNMFVGEMAYALDNAGTLLSSSNRITVSD